MNSKFVLRSVLKKLSYGLHIFYLMPFLFIFNVVLQAQWVQTSGPGGVKINSLKNINGYYLAGTDGGLYLSTNNGANWIKTGLTGNVKSLASDGVNVYAGTTQGLFISTNYGTTWIQPNNQALMYSYVYSLAISGSSIFAGISYSGVFISTDMGQTWVQSINGMPIVFGLYEYPTIYSIFISQNNIYAGSNAGVFLSTNSGASWTQSYNGLTNTEVQVVGVINNNIFAGTNSGMFVSTNNGADWASVNIGLTYTNVLSLSFNGNNIYAGTGGGVFLSTNNGTNWNQISPLLSGVYSLNNNGNIIDAGTLYGIYRSTDNDINWTLLNNGFNNSFFNTVFSLAINGNNIFAGTDGGAYISTDDGINWIQINNGLTNSNVRSLIINQKYIFAGTDNGIFLSTNDGISWNQVGANSYTVFSMCLNGNDVYASTTGGVFVSKNDGASWGYLGLSAEPYLFSIIAFDNNVVTGTGAGLHWSTNSGSTWGGTFTGMPPYYVRALAVKGTSVFAGTDHNGSGIYVTTDYGLNWTQANNGLSLNTYSLFVNGDNLFAGGYSGGIYLTTNDGANWTHLNEGMGNYIYVNAFSAKGTNMYAGLNGYGVWKRPLSDFILPVELNNFTAAVNNSTVKLVWQTVTELNNSGFEIQRKGAKTEWTDLSFIRGNGSSNIKHEYSFTDNSFTSSGIYSYRLKQIDNDGKVSLSKIIQVNINIKPICFSLEQNYPNPFNPSTIINYSLPKDGNVRISVFDAIGSKVATIANEYKPAGNYSVQFNGSNLPSGIYMYKLESGNYSTTKKFILLK